jgi:uncharacterized protein DUF3859
MAGRRITWWRMAFALPVFAYAAALAAPAGADDARIERIDLIAAGFYDAAATRVASTLAAPAAAGGKTNQLADISLMSEPPLDTARLGIGFGVRFRSAGAPRGARATLRSVWKIPEPGIHNPDNGTTYRESVAEFTTAIGAVHWRGYGFDQPWEVVPGVWTIEIWQADRKLLEKSFTIGPPAAAPAKQ